MQRAGGRESGLGHQLALGGGKPGRGFGLGPELRLDPHRSRGSAPPLTALPHSPSVPRPSSQCRPCVTGQTASSASEGDCVWKEDT